MAMNGNHSSDNIQSRRATRHSVSSPWNKIVRGESETPATSSGEHFPSAAVPVDDSGSSVESSDNGGGHNGNTVRKPAWNKPSNGEASEVRPVIDAMSWPALSESARAKSESSKGLLDGSSVPQSQGMGSTPSSFSQRQVNDNASVNNVIPSRQKPTRHSSSNASSNGGHPQQSVPPVSIAATMPHNSSQKDHTQRSGFVPNDHPQQRNSFRNRYSGPHQRGDGAHHHIYGNRRDQDWNTHRNFSGSRDMHMSQRAIPRFIRPPPPPISAQFIHPSPVRPFGAPIGFNELAPPVVFVAAPPPPPDSLRGLPFVPPVPPHALFFTGPDPQLHTKIVNQIDYYFSNENLIKDTFLLKNMDDQGWVPIKLIAGFNKVMHLTDNIQFILDAVRTSSVVEVQGDRIRRRNDWRRWIMPAAVQLPNVTTPGGLDPDMLAERVHNLALETSNYDGAGGLDVQPDFSQYRPAFGDLNSPSQLSTGESTGQVGIQGSDHSISARN